MPPLKIEVSQPDGDDWREAAVVMPGDQYGSISDNTPDGRDVYYFGIDMLEGTAVIKKSEAGIDSEVDNTRLIHDLGGTSLVASLAPGETHELTVKTDKGIRPLRVKFTHLPE